MADKNAHLKIDRNGVIFIENWEAYVGYVYDDKVPARKIGGKLVYTEYKGGPVRGTLTIGIGHTKAARSHVDMSLGAKMSHEEARRVLDVDLDPCEAAVRKLVKVELTQGQFDALVSFAYNCGEGALAKSSILSKLNRGNYAGARASLALYNKSGGEVMLGLKRRRAAEQALWDQDSIAVDQSDPTQSEETMQEVVPKTDPVVHAEKGMVATASTTEGAGSIVQTGAGGTGLADQVDKAIAHADKAIEIKNTAEQFGVEPITIFGSLFGKLGPTLSHLIAQPMFWVFLAVTVTGVYIFFRRRWRLRQEL